MQTQKNAIIYLDNHSTTQVAEEVIEAMAPFFNVHYGNPKQSLHAFNWTAQAAIEKSARSIAQAIGVSHQELIFTSSATEANYLAIMGVKLELIRRNRKRIITSKIEHSSVLFPIEALQKEGFEVDYVPVSRDGVVDIDALNLMLQDSSKFPVGLVSLAAANHEVGTIQNYEAIGELCKKWGALFHSDAVQLFGRQRFSLNALPVDLMSFSAHKIHGPKGCGALYIKNKNSSFKFETVLKLPTPNVPAIVGFGKAVELCMANLESDQAYLKKLRDRLEEGLRNSLDEIIVNGSQSNRLNHNLNVSFPSIDGSSLFSGLRGVAVSNASSCLSEIQDYSQVLTELGHNQNLARASIRFGLSKYNTGLEIETTIQVVSNHVNKLAKLKKDFELSIGLKGA